MIIFHSIPGHSAVQLINGFESKVIVDRFLLKNTNMIKRKILPVQLQEGISSSTIFKKEQLRSWKGFWIIYFGGKKILWINDCPSANIILSAKIELDLVIISSDSIKDLEEILRIFDPKKVIFDCSNQKKLAFELSDQANLLNLTNVNLFEGADIIYL